MKLHFKVYKYPRPYDSHFFFLFLGRAVEEEKKEKVGTRRGKDMDRAGGIGLWPKKRPPAGWPSNFSGGQIWTRHLANM